MTVVSIDANNNLLFVAICICEVENTSSWRWLMNFLNEHIGVQESRTINSMSHRQKCTLTALAEVFQNHKHRFYCKHLYANFSEKFHCVKLRDLFWAAAMSSNAMTFQMNMEETRSIDMKTYEWLIEILACH